MRLIDADGSYTLNECNETGHSLAFDGGFIDVYDKTGKHICQFWAGDAPTIEARPVVRGEWEEYQVALLMCCSECDWATGVQSDFNFRPNCGADMRGDDNG